MRVNIVVKPGWILERMARELAERIPQVTISATGWPPQGLSDDDVTYFLPGKNVRHINAGMQKSRIMIGYFTHGDDRAKAYWDRFDVALAMNENMADCLRELGARRVRIIRPGTVPPAREVLFGVCARIIERRGPKARKGIGLVAQAVRAGYHFVACSPNPQHVWPCPVTYSTDQREEFYQAIDYLVVSSIDEGGPMPVIEAIAHHVPVIAPDVGWCWEFPVIRYERASWSSLQYVLDCLAHPPTWAQWAEDHRKLFAELERSTA